MSTALSRRTVNRVRRRRLFLESLEARVVFTTGGGSGGSVTTFFSAAGGLNAFGDTQVFASPALQATNDISARLPSAVAYLQNHASALGLQPADIAAGAMTSGYVDTDGTTHLYLQQSLNNLTIENARLNLSVAADGRLLTVGSNFVAGTAQVSAATLPELDATTAAVRAAEQLGLGKPLVEVTRPASGADLAGELLADGASLDPVPTRLAYVNTASGVRLGWQFVFRTPDGEHWYNSIADATNGDLLFVSDWIDDLAAYYVYPIPGESPQDISRSYIVNPASSVASPFGWHDTNGSAGAEFTDTRGNNVFAQDDLDANNSGGSRPSGGTNLQFFSPIDLTQPASSYVAGATTNLFYWNNLLHDIHNAYGFTEAAGNFQQLNYSGSGAGADPVQADAQDGSGTNNANFGTPPDGSAPRMQQYIFTSTTPTRDSDLEAGIITHEYGHGVSNRLTGGPADANALNNRQSGGMGEGWSDYFALMITQRPTDLLNSAYPMGNYVIGQSASGGGIRRNPYSYNMTIDPITFANYGAFPLSEVHNSGEIWASALWDLNWLLINKYGYDPDLSTGYTTTGPGAAGNKLSLRLTMDALKLQVANPTFIQARDAILTADINLTGGRNQREIWSAFARRQLGFGASTPDSTSETLVTSTALPASFENPGVITQAPTGMTHTAPSTLDLTFSEAMDPTSFSLAADVVSFTGPGNVNLLPSITGFSFLNGNTTLRLSFTPQSAEGSYQLVLGSDVRDTTGNPLEQDGDSTPGESPADQYTANFRFDAGGLSVLSTTPQAGTTVGGIFNTLEFTFSEPVLAASVGVDDVQPSQGTITGFTIVSPTVVRYDVTGLAPGLFAVNMKYGAVTDAAGFPVAFFEGVYGIPNTYAELVGGVLTITDTPDGGSDDNITIIRSGTNLRIVDSAGGLLAGPGVTGVDLTTVDIPFANITGGIIVNTLAGNDTLTVNLSGGDAVPDSGITFNGGANTATGDRLIITGGAEGTVTYSYTNASGGSVAMSAFGTVNYTTAEGLTNSGTQTSAVFLPTISADVITLDDDGTVSNNTSQFRSGGTFVTTVFTHPSSALTISGGAGDSLTLNTSDTFAAAVTVTGMAGIGINRLTTSAAVSLTATGSIVENTPDGTVDLTAPFVSLSAGTGIATADALETAISSLEANGGSGGVNISNTGLLTIGGVSALTGLSATGGDLIVTTTGSITVNEAVTNSGSGAVTLTAATGVVGAYNLSTPTYAFQDIAAVGTRLSLGDDDVSASIPIGFTFNYYGVDYSNVYICSNGFISVLSGQATDFDSDAIPNTNSPNGIIAGFWNDLYPPNAAAHPNGGVYYAVSGAVGSRVFIVEYKAIPNYSGSASDYTFQIKLFETTNVIEIHYLHAHSDGSQGSAGIENATGTLGTQSFLGTGDIADNTAVSFTPPGSKVIVNANISTAGAAALTLNAANDIEHTAGAITAAGAGQIIYNASTVGTDNKVTMAAGTSATAGAGGVSVTAKGNITVSSITATGAVTLTTATTGAGAVLSGATGVDVVAPTLTITSGAGGIGANGNPFSTNVGSLATNSSGAQFLTEADFTDIAAADLNAGSAQITLVGGLYRTTAGGSILSPAVVGSGATLGGVGTTTAVQVNASGLIAPGVLSGIITTGNTTFLTGGVLNAELNGPAPGSGYDQLNVTGTVDVTNAILNLTLGYTPAAGDTFTIVNNDGTDAVIGTFAGLSEGAVATVGGVNRKITYVGGSGNDIVLLANTAPTISNILDQTTPQNVSVSNVAFTVGDAETAVGSLTVSAASSNAALIPAGNITLGGSGANRTISLTPVANQSGTATITVTVNDGAGGTAIDTFVLTVTGLTTQYVASRTATATGVNFTLSQAAVVAGVLNLYNGAAGLPDVILAGQTTGSVAGSLIVAPGSTSFTFVATNGVLPPDNYTLTLRSAADGFHTATGELLDGNADGIAGGDHTFTFSVAAPPVNAVTLSVPAFARGPQQIVNVPESTSLGLPLNVSSGANLVSMSFELQFDSNLLNVTDVTLAAGISGTKAFNVLSAGRVQVTLTFSTPLAGGAQTVAYFTAAVPTTAANRYGERGVLDLTNITLTASGPVSVPGLDRDAAFVNAYFGDVSRDGTYNSFDVQQVSRAAVGLDLAYQQHLLLDPLIISDFDASAGINSFDVQRISRLAVGLSISEAPALPVPPVTVNSTGNFTAAETPTDPPPDKTILAEPVSVTAPTDSTAPLHNAAPGMRSDVDNDGVIDAQDVLWAIYLYNLSRADASASAPAVALFADVNGDNSIDPADILFAVTDFNQQAAGNGESSPAAAAEIAPQGVAGTSVAEEIDSLAYLLATDVETAKKKR